MFMEEKYPWKRECPRNLSSGFPALREEMYFE